VQYFDPSQHGAAQPGAKTMTQATITLDLGIAQETLIALWDRQHQLAEDLRKHGQSEVVKAIIDRQSRRVQAAIDAIESAITTESV
jgi:hypothetical protein